MAKGYSNKTQTETSRRERELDFIINRIKTSAETQTSTFNLYKLQFGQTDGWTEEWVDGRMDGWMFGQRNGWI